MIGLLDLVPGDLVLSMDCHTTTYGREKWLVTQVQAEPYDNPDFVFPGGRRSEDIIEHEVHFISTNTLEHLVVRLHWILRSRSYIVAFSTYRRGHEETFDTTGSTKRDDLLRRIEWQKV